MKIWTMIAEYLTLAKRSGWRSKPQRQIWNKLSLSRTITQMKRMGLRSLIQKFNEMTKNCLAIITKMLR